MGLEIPPPEEDGLGKFTWKATAEQNENVIVYKYEIKHEDGTVTHRTVTDKDGVKSTEEYKAQSTSTEAPRKPIGPPQDLPADATFDASRVVFTDEDGQVRTTIRYTVYTDKGKWWQKEVYKGDDLDEVTKGPLEPLASEDTEKYFPPPQIQVPPPPPVKSAALNEKTNARTPPKLADASSSKFVEDPYLASSRRPINHYDFQVEREAIRARGSVADRYIKNLK